MSIVACRKYPRDLALVGLLLPIALSACGAAYSPSPAASPSPTPTPLPRGTPLATARENLELVVGIERAAGRPGKLVMVDGPGITTDGGRIRPGNGWSYFFADPDRNRFHWRVESSGEVRSAEPGLDLLNLDLTDINDRLHVDSDRAVQIAARSGGQSFVDRYPAAIIFANCRFQAGVLTWHVEYIENLSTLCSPEFWINATTGELLARDVACLR